MLQENALTTLSAVKMKLGIALSDDSSDELLSFLINDASDTFARATDRQWIYKENYEERVDCEDYQKRITVSDHLPIKSVDSIHFEENEIDPDSYFLESKNLGWISQKRGLWRSTTYAIDSINPIPAGSSLLYTVKYTGGYVTPLQAFNDPSLTRDLPYDIEQAVITLALFRFYSANRDESIDSMTVLGDSVKYGGNRTSISGSSIFDQVVRKYQRIEVL